MYNTVEPVSKGHFGNRSAVLYSEVVPISEVHRILTLNFNDGSEHVMLLWMMEIGDLSVDMDARIKWNSWIVLPLMIIVA